MVYNSKNFTFGVYDVFPGDDSGLFPDGVGHHFFYPYVKGLLKQILD